MSGIKMLSVVLLVSMVSSSLSAQGLKKEAQIFGVSVIRSFFNNNCDFMFDHLDQTIVSFESGLSKNITAEDRRSFCATKATRTDIDVNYELYKINYNPTVYDASELSQKYPQWHTNLNMQPGDLFFDGANPIAAGHTRMFVAENMARFVLRKTNNGWLIVAI